MNEYVPSTVDGAGATARETVAEAPAASVTKSGVATSARPAELEGGKYLKVLAGQPALSVVVSVSAYMRGSPGAPVCVAGDGAPIVGVPWTQVCAGTVTRTVSPAESTESVVIETPYSASVKVRPGSNAPSRESSLGK